MQRRMAAEGDRRAAVLAETLALASPIAKHRAARCPQALRAPPLPGILRATTQPRVFILGATSSYPAALETLASESTILVPNAGHATMVDNPSGFADALATALDAGTRAENVGH